MINENLSSLISGRKHHIGIEKKIIKICEKENKKICQIYLCENWENQIQYHGHWHFVFEASLHKNWGKLTQNHNLATCRP